MWERRFLPIRNLATWVSIWCHPRHIGRPAVQHPVRIKLAGRLSWLGWTGLRGALSERKSEMDSLPPCFSSSSPPRLLEISVYIGNWYFAQRGPGCRPHHPVACSSPEPFLAFLNFLPASERLRCMLLFFTRTISEDTKLPFHHSTARSTVPATWLVD